MDYLKTTPPGLLIPKVTLLIVAGAVAVALFPQYAPWLIYDRSAILSGEFWRMFTGHWVHFSLRHLVYDVVPLGIVGWIIETRRLPRLGWFCAIAPWAISAVLLIFEPNMMFCGGLSGLATAAIVYLALWGLSDPAPWRWICAVTLLVLSAKIAFELVAGRTLLGTFDGAGIAVSVASHIAGASTALVFYAASRTNPASRASFAQISPEQHA